MKNTAKILCLVIAIITLLCFPTQCITGAQNGLLLWYTKVLPVLLPFFIISSMITCYVHISPIITTLLLGILCGYPMGAKNVKEYYIQGYFSKIRATQILTICNHASPMFLIGYVYSMQLHHCIPLAIFLFAIYWPSTALACVYLFVYLFHRRHKQSHQSTGYSPSSPCHKLTIDESIENALVLICKIGCYIMLYSILCNLLFSLQNCVSNSFTLKFNNAHIFPAMIACFSGILEMTTGIAAISECSLVPIVKTALITAIASFGGCSSISQTKSAISDCSLSIVPYIISKIICGVLSGITIVLLGLM